VSEAGFHGDVLSREELDALLASLADARDLQEGGEGGVLPGRREIRGGPADRARHTLYPFLARAVAQWAEVQARSLSAVFQTTISLSLSRWEELTLGDLADTIPSADVVAMMETGPPRGLGFLWLGRPLFFSLLALSFGARTPKAAAPVARSYTGIERRFYRRVADEMVARLNDSWVELMEARSRVLSVEGPERLYEESHERVMLATVDVHGLADFGRLRLALPPAPFQPLAHTTARVEPSRRADVELAVREMPVSVRVEGGATELTLRDLSNLEVGRILPLDSETPGELLVRVEGRPKFRAVRGAVGSRLAVQVTDRV